MRSFFSCFNSLKVNKNSQFVTKPAANIYVALSPIHGRGVFAQKNIKPGRLIEECPIIKIKQQEIATTKHMLLNYYGFWLDEQDEYTGISLGYGSLYNHAANCNANYYYDKDKELMVFEASQLILKNQEITINYLGQNAGGLSIERWIVDPEQ